MNMWAFLFGRMSAYPDSLLFDGEEQCTYQQMLEQVRKVGDALAGACPAGTKCAVLCGRGLHTAQALLACWYADMVPIPMSVHYGRGHWDGIIAGTQPALLITDLEQSDLHIPRYHMGEKRFWTEKPLPAPDPQLEGAAVILCTSGTTGTPKGVVLSAWGVQQNVEKIRRYFAVKSKDRILIARPLYHCAVLIGEFLTALCGGLDIGFLDEKYSPAAVLQFTKNHKISVLGGTPTLFYHLAAFIRRDGQQSHRIRAIAISGECLHEAAARQIRQGFPGTDIYHVYGLTEAGPRVSWLPPRNFDQVPTSAGIPLAGVQIKIAETDGTPLPAYTHGHIFVRTPCRMIGYYNDPEATDRAFLDGWLDTGDIGYQDALGYLFILSRADDRIIQGGMNIYPQEVEAGLAQLPFIQECMVWGAAGAVGQHIAAAVVLRPENLDMTHKEVLSRMAEALPPYQIPSELQIVEMLPRNASGKIVRRRPTCTR